MNETDEDEDTDNDGEHVSVPKVSNDSDDKEADDEESDEEEYGDKWWDNLDEDGRAGYEDNMNKG